MKYASTTARPRYSKSYVRCSGPARASLWLRMLGLYFREVTCVGMDGTDRQRARIAREIEDCHRDLGHDYYDWRRYGGSWQHFIHRGDGE